MIKNKPKTKSIINSLVTFLSRHWFIFILIPILILIAYSNGLHNDFVSDDIQAIPQNRRLGMVISPLENPHSFTASLIYAMIYKVGGLNPAAYRSVNIFFHIGCALLIYFILLRLSKKPVALLASALFAVHPLLVEGVTWISGGPYNRYTFFLLLSFLCYISIEKKVTKYASSIFFFFIATTLTEKAIMFPAIIALYELSFGNLKKNWFGVALFFGIDFLWLGWYVIKLQERVTISQQEYYSQPGLYNPLVQIPTAITSYLNIIFWPQRLTLYESEVNFPLWQNIIRGLITLVFLGVTLVMYLKNKFIFFWLAFFVICLTPTLLPFKIGWIVAERYAYMSSIGIFVVTAYFVDKLRKNEWLELLYYPFIIIVIFALSIRTYIRNIDWFNEDTLWVATANTSPSDFKTHNNIGITLQKHGQFDLAEKEFKIALAMNPRYADVYYNMGLLYYQKNETDKALANYRKTIEIHPKFWQAYNGIAVVLIDQGKYEEAEPYLQKTLTLNPYFAGTFHNLGIVYDAREQSQQAVKYYQKALEMDPTMWNTHFVLGRLYVKLNQISLAKQHLQKSIELHPDQKESQELLERLKIETGR